ncbi:hypothetical protein [Asanoa siamensis]|uniref:Uncharacterized protein n=1 Tax=Asanoa siamensis TaxID=926357 RepID=A0ABQ4CTZ2_9ACTN|nr:hypothetical protein [Asanoa siamensis]GIF74468.1 hypothetical protein Asi02nite_39860 [Asanoa siamensis]
MSAAIDVNGLIALADQVRAAPARRLELTAACDGVAWLAHVPAATESCVNLLAQSDPRAREMPCELGSSSMEVPSAVATFRRWWPKAVIAMGDPGQPDPREPLRPGVVLWRFDGVTASPAIGPPSATGSAAIAALFAGLPWEPPSLMVEAAAPLADVEVEDLLASLVHPLRLPSGRWERSPGSWERYLQAWCCLGLLHHRPEQPWPTSARRRLLVELAYGVEDWVTEAALYALVAAAWADPACRADVAELVRTRYSLMRAAAETRPLTIGASVAQLVAITPEAPPRRRSLLDKVRRRPTSGQR